MILHAIDNLHAESGGPTTVVIEFARQQVMLGKKVAVLCRKGPRRPEQRELLAARWQGLGIEYIELGDCGARNQRGLVAQAIDRLNPEIVHVHCTWEAMVRHAADGCYARGIPYVLSTHGMLHPKVLRMKWLKKRLYLAAFPRYLPRAAEVYSLNREEAEHVRARFNPSSSVLPNGIEVDEYVGRETGEFRKLVPQLGDRGFILYVGRLHPVKGVDQLVRSYAIARRKGCRLDLVLVGPDRGARGMVEDLIRSERLEGCVHLPGGLFGPEKRDAFAACSVFAHRPRFEGFGITVVEGLAAGRPVVTTPECRLDGSVEAGALLQVPDTDEDFANGILRLSTDEELSGRLGRTGQAWVRETFDWKSLVARVDASYASAKRARAGSARR